MKPDASVTTLDSGGGGESMLVRRLKEIAARHSRGEMDERRPAMESAWPTTRQLPLWPESSRGTPNLWLRGALFAAIHGKDRRAFQRVLLATISGVEIRFSGWQLVQSDLDVWEAVVHLARVQGLGHSVEFSAYQILKTLSRPTGQSEREWLRDSFTRLAGAVVELKAGDVVFFGALLKGTRNEVSGRYVVQLDLALASIYESGWTRFHWDERQKLRRKPLALWLHGWYSTHAQPYSMQMETIRRLSGSSNTHSGSFRRQLGKALDELVTVGSIFAWSYEGCLVKVQRRPSASQARYLAKKAGGTMARRRIEENR
ncbi:plasmid replication initiator TrfA [Burkholderia sp. Cy-637]|uniref:plasmid replication initiator TrfA n=1 Tax=Burkholderia sp. Cy-637 TaxID=2608327 RepID=UPI00141E623D|nr:plasmid replication initiator TrfA [Burkholderia sp. Cy-637]